MQRLKKRIILGLYYSDELHQLSPRDVWKLLKERQKLIQKYLHDPHSEEDPRTWPDYEAQMIWSLQRRLEQLRGQLLRKWTLLLEQYPEMETFYANELAARDKIHSKKHPDVKDAPA